MTFETGRTYRLGRNIDGDVLGTFIGTEEECGITYWKFRRHDGLGIWMATDHELHAIQPAQ